MFTTDRTVWISCELQLAKVCSQRFDQQQPTDEWRPGAKDQLDDLTRLQCANDPWQNAQHAALSA